MKHLTDCDTCMQKLSADQRRLMACGFEPAHPAARAWVPPVGGVGYAHDRPRLCVGYTTSLPQVNEAAYARLHWEKGELASATGGPPSESLMDAITILDVETSRARSWAVTPAEKGGGAS